MVVMRRFLISRPIAGIALASFVAILTLLMTSASWADGVSVEVFPNVIAPSPHHPVPMRVIVRNGGPAASHVIMSVMKVGTNCTVRIVPTRGALTSKRLVRLGGGGDRFWRIRVAAKKQPYLPGKVYFIVRYRAAGRSHVATASLDVQSPVQSKLEDVAAVEVKTTLDTLDEQHPGIIYLMITNKSQVPIAVADLRAWGPDFVSFAPPKQPTQAGPLTMSKPLPADGVPIQPRETRAIAVPVSAASRVRPGKHLLLFDIHLRWNEGSEPQDAHLIETQQAQIGVFGEGQIQSLLSNAPTMMLLPGVLAIAGFGIAWHLAKRQFSFDSTELAVIGVSLSFLFVFGWRALGGVDYVGGAYGIRDLVVIWGVSLAVGAGIALLLWAVLRKVHLLDKPSTP